MRMRAIQRAILLYSLVIVLPGAILTGNETAASHYFTTSDGVRLHYLEKGRGDVIIFIPGWTMPATIWKYQIDHFSKQYRVIALDMRSQGDSEKVSEGHYPMRRARDVQELIEHIDAKEVTLVGWSLGVVEVLTYIDMFGNEKLNALVLVDGFIGADTDQLPPQSQFAGMLMAIQQNRDEYTKRFVRSMFRIEQTEEFLRELTEVSLKTPTNTAFTLLANLMVVQSDLRHVLRRINCPAVYIVTPQLMQQVNMIRKDYPHIRVEIFENEGHALFIDNPDRFNTIVMELIDKENQ